MEQRQGSVESLEMKQINAKYWANKKVLVTGHEGFLGSWLTRTLVENGAQVVGIDKVLNRPVSVLNGFRNKFKAIKGNVDNLELLKKIIKQHKPEVIFHLAAQAIVHEANQDPIECFRSNIQGTWNILEAARGQKFIESIIVASSDKAYGSHKKLPYTEKYALQGDHPYDVSKSCADLICYTYFHSYQVPVMVTRCGNIYGGGDYNLSRIVPGAVISALKSQPLIIRSNGKFTRDYNYVEDIVSAYLVLAQKAKKLNLYGQAFNFSDEFPISVLDLFKKISKLASKKVLPPKILNRAHLEIMHQSLSSLKARRVLGWRPQYSLSEGLIKTIAWYKEHINL
jgi:CDP-glucose 4,6-dehydratase